MKTINTMADLFAFWRENPDAVVKDVDGDRWRLANGNSQRLTGIGDWIPQGAEPSWFPMTYEPLRDVFTDPKPGDVIEAGPAHDAVSRSVLFATEKYVFYEYAASGKTSPGSMTRADWEMFGRNGWRATP